jgi:hypothetical protein
MKFILVAILFLTTGCRTPVATAAESFDLSKLSEKGREAYRIVRETEIFALGGVGVAGTTSAVENAVRVLIAEPNGGEALADLTEHATPEGRLMALYGLRCASPPAYKSKLSEIRALPAPARRGEGQNKIEAGYVKVMAGCMIMPERWADVLSRVASEAYPCPSAMK